jgi:hypothetical protein
VALAEEETDLRLFPPLRAGWALRGQPAPVPIRGGNAKRVLLGTSNILTGHRLFRARRQQRAADCQAFREEIHAPCRGGQVSLLLAADSSHTAADSQERAEGLGIELLGLPKRSPHRKPRDHWWRYALTGRTVAICRSGR